MGTRNARRGSRFACLTLLATANLLCGSPARAAFTQATCPSVGWDTAFPVRLGTKEFDTAIGFAPDRYSNWQHHQWTLLVNRNVKFIDARIGPAFDAETNFDYLKVFHTSTYTYTGPFTPGYLFPWQVVSDAVRGNHVQLLWHSDPLFTRPSQPHFDEARVRCHSTVQPTTPMPAIPANTRVEGLLIKSGDVIYTSVYQPAYSSLQVAVDVPPGAATQGADFDLYLSTTTTTPDNANYTQRDITTGASAFAGTWDTAAYGRYVYIGVRSYSGAGQFTLHAYTQGAGNKTSLKVCINGVDKPTGLTAGLSTMLKAGSAWLSQATLGQFRVTDYNVVSIPYCAQTFCSQCDSSCDVCTNHPSANSDFCGFQSSGGVTRIPYYTCGAYNDPVGSALTLAHELGHSQLSLGDEYFWRAAPDHSRPWCGHTLMNLPYGNARGLCTSLNHCFDGEDEQYPCSPSNSAWNVLASRFATTPPASWSADPSRYLAENPSALAGIPVQ